MIDHKPVNPWLVAVSVMFATFMEVLDTTVVKVSLPHIAGSLSATIDEATWVLTSYLVANAIILPMTGWLASVFGRKRLLMASVVGFTASSFLCGLAPNLGWVDQPFGDVLQQAFPGLPVVVANDGDLGALGEHLRGAGRGVQDLVYVHGDAGIGAGWSVWACAVMAASLKLVTTRRPERRLCF